MTTAESDAQPVADEHGDAERGARRRLAVYLQDHDAGAQAGVSLIRRCRDANQNTEFASALADIAREIEADRDSLRSIMGRLDVQPSRVKELLGSAAEMVGRLKSNGHFVRYSPSSRLVEIEAMAAGVVTKRNLWRALASAAPAGIPRPELDALAARATNQFERLTELHQRAAELAFSDDHERST